MIKGFLTSFPVFLKFVFVLFCDVKSVSCQSIFIYASDVELKDVIFAISKAIRRNVIISSDVTGKISLRMKTDLETLWSALESTADVRFKYIENNIVVVPRGKVRTSKVVRLKFHPPKNAVDAVAHLGVKSQPIHANMILVEGEEEKVQLAEKLISEIDRPPKQVLIEAKIVELTARGARELGSLLKAVSGNFEGGFDLFSGKAYVKLDTGDIEYIIGMLEKKGEAKTLSSPKILAVECEKAEIRQGVSVPYDVSTQFTLNTVFYDAFLSLEVTPRITENKIVLETKISKNFPTFEVVSARGVPAISRNEVISKLVVENGQTIAIGGIIIDTNSESFEGVPILSSIPVVGFLFKNHKRDTEKREINIFMKPSILED